MHLPAAAGAATEPAMHLPAAAGAATEPAMHLSAATGAATHVPAASAAGLTTVAFSESGGRQCKGRCHRSDRQCKPIDSVVHDRSLHRRRKVRAARHICLIN
jgi:hypothetical protein